MVEVEQKNDESKKLNTMLSLDVYLRLLDYAKTHTVTGLGTWDFGVAIRKLLDNTEILYSQANVLRELESVSERVNALEESHIEKQTEKEKPEHTGFGKQGEE
tara:strand:- start:4250 stop:4558 length:309 start_codon:yes stop_codon:yes gene_type:complete